MCIASSHTSTVIYPRCIVAVLVTWRYSDKCPIHIHVLRAMELTGNDRDISKSQYIGDRPILERYGIGPKTPQRRHLEKTGCDEDMCSLPPHLRSQL